VKFHIHMLLTCRIYLNHDSYCDRFACQFLVRSFFAGVVSICYMTLGMDKGNAILIDYIHRAIPYVTELWRLVQCIMSMCSRCLTRSLRTQYAVHLPALFMAFYAYRSLCSLILLQFGVSRFQICIDVLYFCCLCSLCLCAAFFWRDKEY